jgi:HK97 gp10 family phage protein
VALKGLKAHTDRLKAMQSPTAEKLVGRALFAGGEIIQTAAQISITTGAVSGAGHVASRPGEAPNQDTGVLGGNIETNQISALKVIVGSYAGYSKALEFGTSRMAARPFMVPARDKSKKEVRTLVARALEVAVKRAGSTSKGK